MDQIITYNKSFQQRLQEYEEVLSVNSYQKILPGSQVKKEWSFYLELLIDAIGWQAIWKIPRLTCEKLKISYPTIVLVCVDRVEFHDLTALVKILAVQDDIHLPERHYVPLVQLWPTKEQDPTILLNLEATANAVDMLRFFYNHLWMPWDVDEDDTVDWVSKHLEVRLHLYYEMKMGMIPRKIAEQFHSIISEARTIQSKRERLEEELSDTEDVGTDLNVSNSKDKEKIDTLVDLHIRMTQLISEVDILENPVMRERLLKRQKEFDETRKENTKPECWLIFKSGSKVNEYMDYLRKVETVLSDNVEIKTAISAQSALDSAAPNDIVIFSAGTHRMRSTGSLEEGGIIKGLLEDKSKTVVENKNESIMLDFSGDVLIENLMFEAGFVQCGMIVRKGCVTMKNCAFSGKGESSTHQGIIALAGSEIILENCDIEGFFTGIVANGGSKLTMRNCKISNVDIGLKIFDGTIINLVQCHFFNCSEYGIYMETEKSVFDDKQKAGDISLLNAIPETSCADCTFDSNKQGNVMMLQKLKIIPVKDLFANPDFNSTLYKIPYGGMVNGKETEDSMDESTGESMDM